MRPSSTMANGPGSRAHERVIAAVKHAIAEGRYRDGLLPSYRQFAEQLGVSMANVRRGMAELESAGVVRREKRRGVFPCGQAPAAPRSAPAMSCINFIMPLYPLADFLQSAYLEGYTEALDHRDIRMRFISLDPEERDYGRLFASNVPIAEQGCVLVNVLRPELLQWLKERRIPFAVQCFARYATEGLPEHFGIYVNKDAGAFQAVNYLRGLGHRCIGYSGMRLATDHPSNRAYEGYRAALACAGLDCSDDLCLLSGEEGGNGNSVHLAKQYLLRPRRPTAVLASSDMRALDLMEAARALGLRVPEDLSIMGFNNQREAELSDPPLTTMSVPRRELAKGAVEMLLNADGGAHLPGRRVLECHLIVRKTTAPPAADGPVVQA